MTRATGTDRSDTSAPQPVAPREGPPRIAHWIAGRASAGRSARVGTVCNPATGTPVASVPMATSADVNAAVRAAAQAFPAWRDMTVGRRSSVLFRFRELVLAHAEELATTIVREHGKVLADARGEVQRGVEVVEFACGMPHLIQGEFSQDVSNGVDSFSSRQPLGVVAGITPFNFPVMVPMWMFPVAIAAGNAFILKPSERDPSAAMLLASLWKEAGLPDGVFNVVHGDREAVDAILEHPDIAAVSFVGSTPVARHVYETAARHGKRVQALGGAKNHMVVLPDANIALAADAAVNAAFGSAGQRCMAISVLVTVGEVADRLLPAVAERMRGIRVGDGMDPASDMGPLVTREHLARVEGAIEDGIDAGATLMVDGRAAVSGDDDGPRKASGWFLGPCLFDHVRPDMSLYTTEIFGPVLCVVRVPSLDEALTLVNSNPWANGVAVFTADGGAARRFQRDADVGMVGINVPIPVPMAWYSFGGWKASLFGDAGVHGAEGVRFYTRVKTVSARWPSGGGDGRDLGFPTAG